MIDSDFNITLFEACELLNRSKKSISRYIKRGLLHPKKVKSPQGTLEYRFSKADIEAFKAQEAQNAEKVRHPRADRTEWTDETGQTGQSGQDTLKRENRLNKGENNQRRQDTPEQTGQRRQDRTGQESEVITLLKETIGLLRKQLVRKDEQIKDLGGKIDQLIERDRETNILIGQLQSKVLMLEKSKEPIISEAKEEIKQGRTDKTGQNTIKPLKEKKTKAKPKAKIKPVKVGFWQRLLKKLFNTHNPDISNGVFLLEGDKNKYKPFPNQKKSLTSEARGSNEAKNRGDTSIT